MIPSEPTHAQIVRLTQEAALIVGDDGTGDLYTICEWALRDDPAATVEDVAEIVREAIDGERKEAIVEPTTVLWIGTLDNLDCDDELARERGIDTTSWPARVIERESGELRLEISSSGLPDEDESDGNWISPSRFRDCYPAIPASLVARLTAAGEIEQ